VASSQELLGSYTRDKELCCRRLVTGDKTWINHWALLSKLEIMHWKVVDRPTFTRICKSAINWLDWQQLFWDTDGLLMTVASWKDNYWSVLH